MAGLSPQPEDSFSLRTDKKEKTDIPAKREKIVISLSSQKSLTLFRWHS